MPIDDGPSVAALVGFLRRYAKQDVLTLAQNYPADQTTLTVSLCDLRKAHPDFAETYLTDPVHVIDRLTEALQQYDLPIDVSLAEATVRLNELPDEYVRTVGTYSPSEVRNRVVGVRGQVAKRSTKRMLIQEAVFECQRCGTLITVPQVGDDSLTEPHECSGCERQGPFRLDHDRSTVADHQRVRLQTPPEAGTTTRENIDVTLTEDLVGAVDPGDRVIVNALMQLVPTTDADDSRLLDLVGEGESVDPLDAEYAEMDISQFLDQIREIAHGADPLTPIVDSIAPSHYGHRSIKTAIALQLFGGTDLTVADGSRKRGTIHVFLVGDPGSGKSALLRYAEQLSPRSVYTAGKQSTTAGLTAACVSDDFGDGGFTLEAGALVEANDGLCAIDELDDMAEETQAGLLEAMADQKISVSKAGITTTLPAQTTVLAAANPIHGRFDQYESIADQIGIDPVLLSRFDLVFTISDTPDPETDRDISHHTLTSTQATAEDEATESEATPALSPELLRAYIAHARTFDPTLTDPARDRIEDEYVAIRQANDDDGPVPTTPRMNHALRRLAGAHARMRLAEEITVADVRQAIAIHREYLEGVGVDPETGEFDVDIVETGGSMSQRKRMKTIRAFIEDLEHEEDFTHGAPYEAICEMAADFDITEEQVEHALDSLCEKGQAYQPHGGEQSTYRLT